MRRAGASLLLGLVLFSTPASAQDTRADVLFREGREAMKRRDYKVACAKFEESQKLDPADGTLVNLATCEEQLGKREDALRHARLALKQLGSTDPMREIASGLVARLAPKVLIDVPAEVAALAGVVVHVDDSDGLAVEVPKEKWGKPVEVAPGEATITVQAHGYDPWKHTINVAVGGPALKVTVGKLSRARAAGDADTKPRSRAPVTPTTDDGSKRSLGIGLILGGVVAGAGAYYFHTKASEEQDKADTHCVGDRCTAEGIEESDLAKRNGRVATALGLTAVGAMVAGVVLVAASPSGSGSSTTKLWIRTGPTVGRGGALSVGASW